MKKILFPALAILLMAASPSAFAQSSGSGPWYVLLNSNTHVCFAAHRVNQGGEESVLGGPYASQSAALSAISRTGQCGVM